MFQHAAAFVALASMTAIAATADSPFATHVVSYDPAPGQFVQDAALNDPAVALGRPWGGGVDEPGNSSLVSLGGFGGSITLGFDHTVLDDPANPFGLDAIVYGNAHIVAGNPNRRWAECGMIEISRDLNGNGVADDPWYLIPGSHIMDLRSVAEGGQLETQGWDDDIFDLTFPPEDDTWLPPDAAGYWETTAYRLPPDIFETIVVENPNGTGGDVLAEGIWGYADYSGTLRLGDIDADGQIEDLAILPEDFYTRPDHPLVVGMTPGCGGGDAIDIAWAIDPSTGLPANLDGCDFVRITVAVNRVILEPPPPLGELSTEIDAVADVAAGTLGDSENDGDHDGDDLSILLDCLRGPEVDGPTVPCRVMDMQLDGDIDLRDIAGFQPLFVK